MILIYKILEKAFNLPQSFLLLLMNRQCNTFDKVHICGFVYCVVCVCVNQKQLPLYLSGFHSFFFHADCLEILCLVRCRIVNIEWVIAPIKKYNYKNK